jgi:hypothetical protein
MFMVQLDTTYEEQQEVDCQEEGTGVEQVWNKRKIVKMDSKFTGRKGVARSRQVCIEFRIVGSTVCIECSYGGKD